MLRYEICLDYPVLENHFFDNMAPVINIFCNLLPYKSKPLVQKLVRCIVCYFKRFTVKVLCCKAWKEQTLQLHSSVSHCRIDLELGKTHLILLHIAIRLTVKPGIEQTAM